MVKYAFLWIMILSATAFFLVGFYKNIVARIAHILWVNNPETAGTVRDPRVRLPFPSLRTILREAIIQKRIGSRSLFLWLRHFLIFLGFATFFILSQIYPLVIKYCPIEYFVSGAGRGYLKFGLEGTGFVLFIGLTLGLIHRTVFARKERLYVNLWLLLLLWSVVFTGYLAEVARFLTDSHDPFREYSFVAAPIARVLAELPWKWDILSPLVWTIHLMLIACFFACIPFTRFVHIFAAPVGRSVTMGQDTAGLKREKLAEGLL